MHEAAWSTATYCRRRDQGINEGRGKSPTRSAGPQGIAVKGDMGDHLSLSYLHNQIKMALQIYVIPIPASPISPLRLRRKGFYGG